jgi:hypothetical protein
MADLVDFDHEIDESGRPGDEMVAEIAERQHGVVAGRQLFALGFGRGAIDHRIAAGRLRPLSWAFMRLAILASLFVAAG